MKLSRYYKTQTRTNFDHAKSRKVNQPIPTKTTAKKLSKALVDNEIGQKALEGILRQHIG